MIPSTGNALGGDFSAAVQPSRTYRLTNGRLVGHTDGLEAVRQAAELILSTERFAHPLYSWNYGVELGALFGTAPPLLHVRLRDRIAEALLQDDRITGVTDFTFEGDGGRQRVAFTLETVYGTAEMTKELNENV